MKLSLSIPRLPTVRLNIEHHDVPLNFKKMMEDIKNSYMKCDINILKLMEISNKAFTEKLKDKTFINNMKMAFQDGLIFNHKENTSSDLENIECELDYLNKIIDLSHKATLYNIEINPLDFYQAISPNYFNSGLMGLVKSIETIRQKEDIKDIILSITLIEKIPQDNAVKDIFMKFIKNNF